MFLCKGTIKNDKFLKFRNHYNILIGEVTFFFFNQCWKLHIFVETMIHYNLSINQYYCLQTFEWCVSDTRLQLHVSVHSWFGLSDQNALMKVIYDWQQLCWRYNPLFCYTHPFQHWLGLIWLEFSLHPASDLIWRHDLWPSIVFGLICFSFLWENSEHFFLMLH